MNLDQVALLALRRLVTKYKSAGITPESRCTMSEKNVHKMVNAGQSPNFLDAVEVLADSLIKEKVRRFVELPNGVDYPAVVKVITDTSSWISLRVILTEAGIVFDAGGKGDPEKPTIH